MSFLPICLLTKSWSFPLSHPRNSLKQICWFITVNKSMIRKDREKQLSNYTDWNLCHMTNVRCTEWQNTECLKQSNNLEKYTQVITRASWVTAAAQDFLTSPKLTCWVSESAFSSIFTTSNSDELSCKHMNSQCCDICSDGYTQYKLVKNILPFAKEERDKQLTKLQITFPVAFHNMMWNNIIYSHVKQLWRECRLVHYTTCIALVKYI